MNILDDVDEMIEDSHNEDDINTESAETAKLFLEALNKEFDFDE